MSTTTEINWEAIKAMVASLPETREKKKTWYDITGTSTKEDINSNVLGFFLNPFEVHGFGDLFIKSLLELYNQKKGDEEIPIELSFADCGIKREFSTLEGNRIDIVIRSVPSNATSSENGEEDWAIIIENKIYHSLLNPLDDYWSSIVAQTKLGVVLTLQELEVWNDNFINITHNELCSKVLENITPYFSDVNDNYLSLLKDYVTHMNQLSNKYRIQEDMEESLAAFRKHANEVEKLNKEKSSVMNYIRNEVFSVFNKLGLHEADHSNNTAHFYYNADEEQRSPLQGKFRFFVPYGDLIRESSLIIHFELYNKRNTSNAAKVREAFYKKVKPTANVSLKSNGKNGTEFFHMLEIKLDLGNADGKALSDRFESLLKSTLFEHPQNYLTKAAEAYEATYENDYQH